MIRVDCSRIIAASRNEVYAVLIDPIRFDELAGIAGTVHSDEELSNGQRVLNSESLLPNNGATVRTKTVFVERVADARVVFRYETAPALAGLASWLRLGRIDIERVVTLSEEANGTLVRDESRWRFRPMPLHLFFVFLNRGSLQSASEQSLERLGGCVLAARRP
jgi:hypothetical protein